MLNKIAPLGYPRQTGPRTPTNPNHNQLIVVGIGTLRMQYKAEKV